MKRIPELVKRHPLKAFFLITFSISWMLWYFAGRYSPTVTESGMLGLRFLVIQLGEYSPALVGLTILSLLDPVASTRKWHTILIIFVPVFVLASVMSQFAEADILQNTPLIFAVGGVAVLVGYVISPLNRSFKTVFSPQSKERMRVLWLALSVLMFPAAILVAKVLTYYQGGEAIIVLQGGALGEIAKYTSAVFFITWLFGGPLGEELGWRGFALTYLQKVYSPLVASITLGFFWALWHAPLDITHGFVTPGLGGVVYRLVFSIPIAFLFTHFYNRTNGSLFIAILLHTSANFGFTLFPFQTVLSFGVFVVIAWILACYAVFTGRMWQKLAVSREVWAE